MARKWSRRARRDFDERRDYRRRRGEIDRYERQDASRTEDPYRREADADRDEKEAARYDRLSERGYDYMGPEDREALLMQIRNAGPDDDVDDALSRLRQEYDYYEMELDDYDADYDRVVSEIERLRNDNRRYMMRESSEGAVIKEQQNEDIRQDGHGPKSFDTLWDEREG